MWRFATLKPRTNTGGEKIMLPRAPHLANDEHGPRLSAERGQVNGGGRGRAGASWSELAANKAQIRRARREEAAEGGCPARERKSYTRSSKANMS